MSKLWIVAFCCVLSTGCERDGDTGLTHAAQAVTCDGSCTFVAADGDEDVGARVSVFPDGSIAWSSGAWFIPLNELAGRTISTVSIAVTDLTGNPVVATYTVNGQPLLTSVSNGSGADQTLTLPVSHLVAAGEVTALVLAPQDLADARAERAGAGSVTALPAPTITTSVIPVVPPSITGPTLQVAAFVSGSGSAVRALVVPLPTVVGTSLVGIRARVTDTTSTTVHIQLADATNNAQNLSVVATSDSSAATGAEQTVSLPLFQSVKSGHQYYALLSPATGADTCAIWRLELDTAPLQLCAELGCLVGECTDAGVCLCHLSDGTSVLCHA